MSGLCGEPIVRHYMRKATHSKPKINFARDGYAPARENRKPRLEGDAVLFLAQLDYTKSIFVTDATGIAKLDVENIAAALDYEPRVTWSNGAT